tara:strand:- start:319 stop:1008 length:690 start_codon:yes stop_codon:yes gene_type:complete
MKNQNNVLNTFSINDILSNSFSIGLNNALNILIALILWIVTLWIPYINVGTSIGLFYGIPIKLARGEKFDPTLIFNKEYRSVMGNMLLTGALGLFGILLGYLFLFIPGIILAYAWAFAGFLVLDKKMNPLEALHESNDLTYGKKWYIFGATTIITIVYYLVSFIWDLVIVFFFNTLGFYELEYWVYYYSPSILAFIFSMIPQFVFWLILLSISLTVNGYMYVKALELKE